MEQQTTGGHSTECALIVDKPFCSDDATVREVSKYIRKKAGIVHDSPMVVIKKAKELTKCETEECALRVVADEQPQSSMIIKKTIKNRMKIDGPDDSQALLNNINIDSVLGQLVVGFGKLKHLKFHMIDFENRKTEMRDINVYEDVIKKGYTTLCVVLNTDKYGNPGIHWFCIFCDFRTRGNSTNPFTIEHFNSSGNKALKPVANWMIKAKYDIEKGCNHHCSIINATPIQHQRDTDTECGVYCLYYIYARLINVQVSAFSQRVKDSVMIDFRKKLFRNRKNNPAS